MAKRKFKSFKKKKSSYKKGRKASSRRAPRSAIAQRVGYRM